MSNFWTDHITPGSPPFTIEMLEAFIEQIKEEARQPSAPRVIALSQSQFDHWVSMGWITPDGRWCPNRSSTTGQASSIGPQQQEEEEHNEQ